MQVDDGHGPHPHDSEFCGPDCKPLSEPVSKVLRSLQPENVVGYTISSGHAFDGITLHGIFETFDEALDAANKSMDSGIGTAVEDWHIVPIWKNSTPWRY